MVNMKGLKILLIERVLLLLLGLFTLVILGSGFSVYVIFSIQCVGIFGHYALANENRKFEVTMNYALILLVLYHIGEASRFVGMTISGMVMLGYVALRAKSLLVDAKLLATETTKKLVKILEVCAKIEAVVSILYVILFMFAYIRIVAGVNVYSIGAWVVSVVMIATEVVYIMFVMKNLKAVENSQCE